MSKLASTNMSSDWRRVRLGDVVENVNDFFHNGSGGAVRYVAGEHIDEGDLRVRRYGLTSDDVVPPTFNRLFKAGDVLFHSRNIRKLAQPDFDGLTGEKLFVLRTKDEEQLPQAFLPFLLQTEAFSRYANERSAGSTNKFLNKTPLMAYEFTLPPPDVQLEVIEALGIAYTVRNEGMIAVDAAWNLLRSLLIETFHTGADPLRNPIHKKWNCAPLSRFINVKHGWAFKGDFFSEDSSSGPQLLTPGNFTEFGWFDLSPEKSKYYRGEFPDNYRLKHGDLLLLMTDLTPAAKLLGAPGMVEGEYGLLHNQRLGKVEIHHPIGCSDTLFSEYLLFFFMSEVFRRQVRALSAGSTVSHSSPTQICRIAIPCPKAEQLESVVAPLRVARETLLALKERSRESACLASSLRQKLLDSRP